jgi:hypothetical protein
MDIEGCEFSALNGAKKTLKKFKPIICLESDVRSFKRINNLLKKFHNKTLNEYCEFDMMKISFKKDDE